MTPVMELQRFTRRSTAAALLLLPALARPVHAADAKAPMPAYEDSVRALESARGQALMHADTLALARMIADEFVEISRFGGLRTKADNMRDISSGDLKLATVKYDDQKVRLYGDVAVLTGIADNTGTFHGFAFGGKIRYMRVFVRRDGRWQAVAMQQTPLQ